MLRAVAEINGKKYREAEQDLHKAMEAAPTSSAPYVQMGNMHLVQKHFSDAEKFYQQALDKDPSSSDALNGLLNTYLAQKQPDKAVAAAIGQIPKSQKN